MQQDSFITLNQHENPLKEMAAVAMIARNQ